MNVKYNTTIEDYYENVYGQSIKIQLLKFSNGIEVNIKLKWKRKFRKKCILLLVLGILYGLLFWMDLTCNVLNAVTALVFLGLIYNISRIVRYERVLVVKSLGYQIETKYLLSDSTKFVPWDTIQDVFINEVITMQRVIVLLTIYTKFNQKLIPLFSITRPRLDCVRTIYRILKSL